MALGFALAVGAADGGGSGADQGDYAAGGFVEGSKASGWGRTHEPCVPTGLFISVS